MKGLGNCVSVPETRNKCSSHLVNISWLSSLQTKPNRFKITSWFWKYGLLTQKAEYCFLFNLSYVTDLIAQVCISCHLLLVSIEVIILVLILSLNETTEIPWIGRGWPLTWGSPPCHWGTARWGCPCTCHTSSHRLADQLCSHRRLPWLQTLEIKACEWEYWVWSPSCWT